MRFSPIIGPSSYVSSLCHSILRGELFSTCSVGCIYCYARWYRGAHGKEKPLWESLKLIKMLGGIIREGLAITPIRVSTLSDPFQGEGKITLKFLKLALKEKVPVIINTKLIPREKHIKTIERLAEEGLVVVQVSLPTLEETKVLEPFAPSPRQRLELIERLSRTGVPTIVRVQPFVPGWIQDIHTFVEEIASTGARMIILEFLRVEKELISLFSKFFPGEEVYRGEWESYLPGTLSKEAPLLHPPIDYRVSIAREFSLKAEKEGLAFSTCKEGLFELHTPLDVDCCGMVFFDVEYINRRPTLWDLYLEILEKGKAKREDLWRRCRVEELLCGENLAPYPRWFKRGFIAHEKRLDSILEKPHIVERIVPSIKYENGYFTKRRRKE
ncbi:MAG: hypothetical protein PWP39_723 [Pyrococcus sp.]|uniref:SPL family radical SAM protein n=1 Tax=Pyrococcus sp. TaxID=33866 RepID=UPI0025845362|nr:radical SAM protein [Pyrococcus sp.]MDK2869488.1 hypothetical protein [Pyrococcus sp.]